MQIPIWWLILSAVFFAMNIVFLGILVFALLQIMKTAAELKPKVDRLTERIETITVKVEEMSTTLNSTLKDLGAKTSHMAGHAEMLTGTVATNVGKFAPLFSAASTAFRVFQMIQGFRSGGRKRNSNDSRGKKRR